MVWCASLQRAGARAGAWSSGFDATSLEMERPESDMGIIQTVEDPELDEAAAEGGPKRPLSGEVDVGGMATTGVVLGRDLKASIKDTPAESCSTAGRR